MLQEKAMMRNEMNMFRSIRHVIYSVTLNKVSLSAFDDKRYLLDDGVTSYAYGHYATNTVKIWRPWL